jgi:TRAP-type mannitol/chloroaromatic compound transport system permease small subunit
MRKVLKLVDSISNGAGNIAAYFSLALVLLIVYEVVVRYVFNAPTMWGYEVCMATGMAMYCIGFAYTESKNAHVRVDVFYIHLSPRGKAIADAVSRIIFFLTTIGLVMYFALLKMIWSWGVWEKSVEAYWYPPWYPTRTLIFLGFFLLFLQGLAHLYRELYHAIKGKPYA